MKKALKIIKSLEDSDSNIKITTIGETVVYENKENYLFIDLLYFVQIAGPLFLIYFIDDLNIFYIVTFLLCSIVMYWSYFSGPFLRNNLLEIDLAKNELKISRKGWLGKLLLKNKVIMIQKKNQLSIKDNSWESNTNVIIIQTDTAKVPLIEVKRDPNFNQIFLTLKLLLKGI